MREAAHEVKDVAVRARELDLEALVAEVANRQAVLQSREFELAARHKKTTELEEELRLKQAAQEKEKDRLNEEMEKRTLELETKKKRLERKPGKQDEKMKQ